VLDVNGKQMRRMELAEMLFHREKFVIIEICQKEMAKTFIKKA
jgi:hypothetical protein